MSQITGKAYITINGTRLRSKEGAKLNIGGTEREAAVSDAGVDGYMERATVPAVECVIHHTPEISLRDIQAFRDGTLIFETDTGKVFTLVDAWCVRPPEMTKGEVTLSFQARECVEA